MSYHPDGQVKTLTFNNGETLNHTYDAGYHHDPQGRLIMETSGTGAYRLCISMQMTIDP